MALKRVQLPIKHKENLQQTNPVKQQPRTLKSQEKTEKIDVVENIVDETSEIVSFSKDQVEVDVLDSQIIEQEENLSCSQEGVEVESFDGEISGQMNEIETPPTQLPKGLDDQSMGDETISEFNFNSFVPIKPKGYCRGRKANDKGSISIVYGENGNRLTLNKELIKYLNLTNRIQIGVNETQLILGDSLGDEFDCYYFKPNKSKVMIYNKSLVSDLIKQFNLDYTNRTSRTFRLIQYRTRSGNPIVVVDMIDNNE